MNTKPIRVVVIDDSAAVRRIISRVFNDDPELEVVGEAADGRAGVEMVLRVKPDIITCDVEMPVLDGLGAVTELRSLHVKAPIVMFSSITEAGSRATLEALSRGATDYAPKPTGVGSFDDAIAQVKAGLVPKLKELARPGVNAAISGPDRPIRRRAMPLALHEAPKAVVIGSSTGGPAALESVFGALTEPLPVPMFVVQHIPPVFSAMLAERLSKVGPMEVVEAEDEQVVVPGTAYLAPGGRHMKVVLRGATPLIMLDDGPLVNSCRPAVDVLFGSTASVYRNRQLAVVLTGMGHDGLNGSRALVDAGAAVLAQDEASSVVWGMPGFVAQAGLADEVMPLDAVGREIERRVLVARAAVGASR